MCRMMIVDIIIDYLFIDMYLTIYLFIYMIISIIIIISYLFKFLARASRLPAGMCRMMIGINLTYMSRLKLILTYIQLTWNGCSSFLKLP